MLSSTSFVATVAVLSAVFNSASAAQLQPVNAPGYALRENPCPPGAVNCGGSCCPNGGFCQTSETSMPICCPSKESCAYTVKHNPRCAMDTWVFYQSVPEGLCCSPGDIGVNGWDNHYMSKNGYCAPNGTDIDPTAEATYVGALATAPPSTSSTSAVKTGTATAAIVTANSGGSGSGSGSEAQDSAAAGASQISSNGDSKVFVPGMILGASGALSGLLMLVL